MFRSNTNRKRLCFNKNILSIQQFIDIPSGMTRCKNYFGSRNHIEQNEVVVVNWEKLYSKYASGEKKGEWKNRIMIDREEVNFIEVLETTRLNRKIILIIDESHYASDAQRTSELRNIINKKYKYRCK